MLIPSSSQIEHPSQANLLLFFKILTKDMCVDFRESRKGGGRVGRERERERNIDVREKLQLPPVRTSSGDET